MLFKEKVCNHTPTPWNYGISADRIPHFYLHTGTDQILHYHIESYGNKPAKEDDIKFIINSVNMHDELVQSLVEALNIILKMPEASFMPAPSNAKQSNTISSHTMANELKQILSQCEEN